MDRLQFFESESVRAVVCELDDVAKEAAARHRLAPGSAAALAQAMAGALLLAAQDQTRADIQLECNGPLKGLLVDAEPDGAVRGLVRVAGIAAPDGLFDARHVLSSPHDEKAGRISILRAQPQGEPQRAAFPFAGGDLGGALTLFLRNDRELGGEIAIHAELVNGAPRVAGILLSPLSEDAAEPVRAMGKPLRKSKELTFSKLLTFGKLVRELTPRFACRCSRERVLRALRSVGAKELEDMARKDGGADLTCDFCAATYRIDAGELLALASQ
jgi:molecular chaperone Hsp33